MFSASKSTFLPASYFRLKYLPLCPYIQKSSKYFVRSYIYILLSYRFSSVLTSFINDIISTKITNSFPFPFHINHLPKSIFFVPIYNIQNRSNIKPRAKDNQKKVLNKAILLAIPFPFLPVIERRDFIKSSSLKNLYCY